MAVAGCALALLLAPSPLAAASEARRLEPPRADRLAAVGLVRPLRDAVVSRSRGAAAARVGATAPRSYGTPDGHFVEVRVSDAYAPAAEAARRYVEFIATRLHGDELGRLRVLIATPREIQDVCAPAALACYVPASRLMIVPGEPPPAGEVSLEYLLTHEYGHHVAAFRRNDPWDALFWGPKRWASHERVCEGVAEGRFAPGDQADGYESNPGENWAEAYALLHHPGAAWTFHPALLPRAPALAAIRRDVLDPWRPPPTQVYARRLTARAPAAAFPRRLALDGLVSARVRGAPGAVFDLEIVDGGDVVLRARGRRPRLVAEACGVRRYTLRVARRSGSGRFALRVREPG